jgi:hypothetical protein
MRRHYFQDRHEAGELFAKKLTRYANRPDVVVLALPRGGVPVRTTAVRKATCNRSRSNAPIRGARSARGSGGSRKWFERHLIENAGRQEAKGGSELWPSN